MLIGFTKVKNEVKTSNAYGNTAFSSIIIVIKLINVGLYCVDTANKLRLKIVIIIFVKKKIFSYEQLFQCFAKTQDY